MSKKSKRSKAKFRRSLNTQKVDIIRSQEPAKNVRVETHTPAASLVYWQEQYKYIRPELLRIFIIAAVFFVVLIILSFIL